jgi:hypothetical protein
MDEQYNRVFALSSADLYRGIQIDGEVHELPPHRLQPFPEHQGGGRRRRPMEEVRRAVGPRFFSACREVNARTAPLSYRQKSHGGTFPRVRSFLPCLLWKDASNPAGLNATCPAGHLYPSNPRRQAPTHKALVHALKRGKPPGSNQQLQPASVPLLGVPAFAFSAMTSRYPLLLRKTAKCRISLRSSFPLASNARSSSSQSESMILITAS